MKIIKIVYVTNIESALAKYLKEGYTLEWIEKSAEVEVRFYLQNMAASNEYVCLARQYWDEFYPEEFDEDFGLPEDHMELRSHSEKEYKETYHAFKKLNMVESVPEGDNLEDVPVIRLKNCLSLRLVHPEGYTWS